MRSLFEKILRRLLFALGVLVILVAVAIGGFRLLIARLPAYQADLQLWVEGELGLPVSFAQLDARWGLSGPELTLHDVQIGGRGSAENVFAASRAGVALDPYALLIDREPRVHRLSLEGVRLTVERTEDGAFRLAGAPQAGNAGADIGALIPQKVEIAVRGGQLDYVDRSRGRSWRFDDVTISLTRSAERLDADVRASPPAGLARRAEIALTAEIDEREPAATLWRVYGDLRDADLAAVAEIAPMAGVDTVAGTGDVALWVDWADGRLLRASADVDLRGVMLPNHDVAAGSGFDRVALIAEWTEDAARNWQLVLTDVELLRNGRRWPTGNTTIALQRAEGAVSRVEMRSDFLRLEDLMPIVSSFADAPVAQQWTELDPRGELRAVDFSLQHDAADWDYSLAVQFDGLGLAATAGRPGISGLTGSITTGARSGTVEFRSRDVGLDWPEIFAAPLAFQRLDGSLVWRQGRDVVRVVSNDLTVGVLDDSVQSSLELTLPLDGSSPHLDIESTLAHVGLIDAKRFLPVNKMPRAVVDWLQNAVQAGSARNVEFTFFGPIAAFPFDGGEGVFRVTADVEGAQLEFIDGWPVAEDLSGMIEFANARFDATGAGRILGNRSADVRVRIPELRNAVLDYSSTTEGPLSDVIAFVRAAPLIADHLGPGYDRLRVHSGNAVVSLDLTLPLLDRKAFELGGQLAIAGGELSIDGFNPHATEIDGVLEFDGDSVTGSGLGAIFLDGPVTAAVIPQQNGYRAALTVEGEATADGVLAAFNLPFVDSLAGQTQWQGRLLLPARAAEDRAPLRIEVQSNLTGVALNFPAPFEKAPSEPSNMQLEFTLPSGGGLEVDGNLGATRRFALRYASDDDGFDFRRGVVQFGGNPPQLPDQDGIVVRGTLPELDLSEWLALGRSGTTQRARPLFLGAELEVSEFSAFGQHLGTSRLDVSRGEELWSVAIESEAIAGTLAIPRSLAERPQVVADMQRVYLATGADAASGGLDPRSLPGLSLHADEFGFGTRRLGSVDADVVADPMGLRLVSFTSTTGNFGVEGSGSWLSSPDGSSTRVAFSINSSDVAAALGELGFEAFLEGEMADVTASVHWPGPPSARWMEHVSGDVAVRIETGSLVDIDPGAGRVVGLLSIAALPRRLALDFRDVFARGFVFDEIGGDFTIIDGNAYTDNLLMSGPGAEIGVVGRTGLRDRDYQQQAVVTAEPGKMLPTVGALVAGPGVGAAWLLFTRIFKEPLKGIGRAAYCVTGQWDAPEVERLSGDRLDEAQQCAALPPAGFAAQSQEQTTR